MNLEQMTRLKNSLEQQFEDSRYRELNKERFSNDGNVVLDSAKMVFRDEVINLPNTLNANIFGILQRKF